MYVNFSDVNTVFPKDPYPLPEIDHLIDGFSGYHTLSFMDSYSGYNQIQMDPINELDATFLSNHGNYYFNVTTFDLKNTRATSQWLIDAMFSHQIWQNLEVYVDDMIVKTTEGHNHAANLKDVL